MMTIEAYIGPHAASADWTPERQANAALLVDACNRLQQRMEADGVVFQINPATHSQVSGQAFGGFRPQNCPIGAPNSRHKQGKAVDMYDPDGDIDAWIMANIEVLTEIDMAIEHPDNTRHWSHWQIGAPPSGHRVFHP
jgi:hypothetical protein